MAIDRQRRALTRTAGLFALVATGVSGAIARAAEPRVVKIVAKKFEFVPNEIRVRQGETVTLEFTAPEVPMGVNLADFAMRTDIIPGKPSTLRLTPNKVGTFTFVCDLFCGSGHEDMSGTLIVS